MRIFQSIFPTEVQQVNNDLKTFLELPLTTEFQEKIRDFMTDFSNSSLVQLSFNREGMETRKTELAAVHTLRHIGFLFSDLDLNQAVRTIQKSSIKWTFFVNGMRDSIHRKKASDTLNKYIPGFAEFLKADANIIQNHIDQNDYKEMFDYLLQI